jgi:hypothetical protein
MITRVDIADDQRSFAKQLITEGVSFHPDDVFNGSRILQEYSDLHERRS